MSETKWITRADEPMGEGRAQVVVLEGADAGRAAALADEALVVGTSEGCGLRLSDPHVSARHLEVRREGGRFAVKDLGSTNGTFFEGSRVGEAEVPPGATLKVGHSYLRLLAPSGVEPLAPSASRRFGPLVAESLAMREVFALLELAASSDSTLLVQGETGTGKELVARAVHDASRRRDGPFVAVDCGALPEGLVESELFGHVKGAFTGAAAARAGAFARAHGGTLFLDELTGVPAPVQARLLRVIEERKVRPVGGDEEKAVDVRLIAAARGELSLEVADGRFRPDLFYRLSVLQVTLPPLRARREDLPALVKELLRQRGIPPGELQGRNLELLMGHGWPGNVRELRNVLERAVALSPGARGFEALRLSVTPAAAEPELAVRTDLPFKEAKEAVVEAFERSYLRELLQRHGGNVSATARTAELDRKHLRALLERHRLRGDDEG